MSICVIPSRRPFLAISLSLFLDLVSVCQSNDPSRLYNGGKPCYFHTFTMDPEYPCGICSLECESDVIECSTCLKWFHRKCAPLTVQQMNQYETKSFLEFHCKHCSHENGSFSYRESLQRYKYYIKY